MKGYIIGNGFDLSHGMSTKYSDFYKYLKKHDQKNIGGFEYFYDCEQENLWGNFEDNIGCINHEHFMAFMGSIYEDGSEEIRGDINAKDVDFEHIICNHKELMKSLACWIKSIKMPTQKFVLPENAIYLSFNYTSLLEDIYSINRINILHIHGEVGKKPLILGYDNVNIDKILTDADCGIYTWEFPFEYFGYTLLEEYLKKFHKDTGRIIESNIDFFRRFSEIDELFILGLSFSKTDIKYLEFILTQINKNVKIHVSYFSKSDRMRISWFKRKHNLINLDVDKIERIMQSHS